MNLDRTHTDQYISDLDFLLDVTRETLGSLQLSSLLRRVAHLMRNRFGYDFAAVALVENDVVVFRAGSGGDLDRVFQEPGYQFSWQVPLGCGVVGKVAQSGKPILANEVAQNPDYIAVDFLPYTKAELTVPLIHRDKILGVLDVQSHEVNAFNKTDIRLLEIVSALVAPAVHIAGIYERERKRSRHLHLVSEISRLVMSSLDRENVIAVACQAILDALDITYAGVELLDPSGSFITHVGHASRFQIIPEALHPLNIGEGLVGQVVANGKPLRLGDVSQYPDFKIIGADISSALCVPLRIREKIIGAVDVGHTLPNHFTTEDESLLENIAVYLAQAMENAQLFDYQRQRWQQLLVINEVARIATCSFDLNEIVGLVAREVHDRFGYSAVAILLVEMEDLIVQAFQGDEPSNHPVQKRVGFGQGIAGWVAKTGQVMLVDSAEQLEGGGAFGVGMQSVLSVPLWTPAGVIGVIQVESPKPEAFGHDDRLIMETLSKSVTGAIANARAIQKAEQLREDLNRMIVHDLRNPVQAVLLTFQEIQRAAEGRLSEVIIETIRDGISWSEDMLEMINSMLDVSRFEAGKAQLRLSPAVLNDHIRAVVKRFTPFARFKMIQVTTVLSQDVPVLRFDHELINRTLANLVSNALKFTPEGARVTIRSELLNEARPNVQLLPPFVLISVQDTGEGIPPEYHRKIFEKYGQVESRKAGLKMSTGLGLALCRYVVEGHGGTIWVESTLGKGSCFFVALPVNK